MAKAIVFFVLLATISSAFGANRCPIDLTFLVDQSTSITRVVYKEEIIPFLTDTVNVLDIGEKSDHVSLVRFSSIQKTVMDFGFDAHYDKEALVKTLNNLRYDGGNTATVTALGIASNNFFVTENSAARRNGYGRTVAPIAVVVTDGVATDGDASIVAKELRDKGVKVFGITVGPMATIDYLQELTGDASLVFEVADVGGFITKLTQVISESTSCA